MGFFSSIRKIFTGNSDAGDTASASEQDQNEVQSGQILAQEPETSAAPHEPVAPPEGQDDFADPIKDASPLDDVEDPAVQTQVPVGKAELKESYVWEVPDSKEGAVASSVQKEPTQAGTVSSQVAATSENDALTLALRAAEPKLSAWLAVVLDGVDKSGDLLWSRLSFLLSALEAPTQDNLRGETQRTAETDYPATNRNICKKAN